MQVEATPDRGLQPSLAADTGGAVHVAYLTGEPTRADVLYRRRQSGGWGTPLRVNSKPGSGIAVGTIRGPHLALGRGSRPHITWTGRGESGHTTAPFLYSRLEGESFVPQRNLMQFTHTLDGGGSLGADSTGYVFAAWHAADSPRAGETGRKLWVAESRDDGRTWSREAAAWSEPTGACACCSTRAFVDRSGGRWVLYRAARTPESRGMVLLTAPRGGTFGGQQLDEWRIGTCPMSAEAAAEGAGRVVLAWENQGEIFWCTADPATRKPGPAKRIGGQGSGRRLPTVAVNRSGQVLVAWSEGTGWRRGGSLAWQIFDLAGNPVGPAQRRAGAVPVWGAPAAAPLPDGSFLLLH